MKTLALSISTLAAIFTSYAQASNDSQSRFIVCKSAGLDTLALDGALVIKGNDRAALSVEGYVGNANPRGKSTLQFSGTFSLLGTYGSEDNLVLKPVESVRFEGGHVSTDIFGALKKITIFRPSGTLQIEVEYESSETLPGGSKRTVKVDQCPNANDALDAGW